MKARTLTGLLTASVLAGAWGAEVKDNPYQEIVNRNAFALKPPPPPPPPGSEQPPASPVEVQLTGITTVGGVAKVLLQITEKGPNKKTEFPPPLVEKDVQGRVEVVSIDADKGAVTIKIDGNERSLNFDKDGVKAGAPAAGPPGAIRPGMPMPPNPIGTVPLPGVTTAAGAAAGMNAQGSGGVLVGGAQPSVPTPGTSSGAVNAASLLNSGVPTRPVRTGQDATGNVYVGGLGATGNNGSQAQATTPSAPAMTREQAIAHIEEQRNLLQQAARLGIKTPFAPLPTTPMTPQNPGGMPTPPAPGN